MAAHTKDEFENATKGFVGVITLDNGKERGIAVRPGARIWLSEDEQVLTANAPRRDEDNPFTNGQLHLRTKAADVKNRRPLGIQQDIDNTPPDEAATPDATDQQSAAPEAQTVAAPKPQTARQRDDLERKKAEATRKAEADAQASQGAIPGKATGASVTTSGIPKVEGESAEDEEVGDPAAPAAKEAVKA